MHAEKKETVARWVFEIDQERRAENTEADLAQHVNPDDLLKGLIKGNLLRIKACRRPYDTTRFNCETYKKAREKLFFKKALKSFIKVVSTAIFIVPLFFTIPSYRALRRRHQEEKALMEMMPSRLAQLQKLEASPIELQENPLFAERVFNSLLANLGFTSERLWKLPAEQQVMLLRYPEKIERLISAGLTLEKFLSLEIVVQTKLLETSGNIRKLSQMGYALSYLLTFSEADQAELFGKTMWRIMNLVVSGFVLPDLFALDKDFRKELFAKVFEIEKYAVAGVTVKQLLSLNEESRVRLLYGQNGKYVVPLYKKELPLEELLMLEESTLVKLFQFFDYDRKLGGYSLKELLPLFPTHKTSSILSLMVISDEEAKIEIEKAILHKKEKELLERNTLFLMREREIKLHGNPISFFGWLPRECIRYILPYTRNPDVLDVDETKQIVAQTLTISNI